MKPKLQQNSSHQMSKDMTKILPSLTMRTSKMWPVISEIKPYAGPTLWTPWCSKTKTKQPFLTLTPSKYSSKHTIPLVSLTPQQNDVHEVTCMPKSKMESLTENDEIGVFSTFESLPPIDSKESLHFFVDSYNNSNQVELKQNKNRQSPIIPDVFSLGMSKRSSGIEKHLEIITSVNKRKKQATSDKDKSMAQWSFLESETNQGLSDRGSVTERNEQDKGTLFSKQHQIMYSHLAKEPTLLPILQNEILRNYRENLQRDHDHEPCDISETTSEQIHVPRDESQNKSPNFRTRLTKQQLKERRNYIRSHAHFTSKKSSASLNCIGHQTTRAPSPGSGLPLSESVKYRFSLSDKNSHIKACYNDVKELQNHLVSSQFCDVLGQKTCRKCQEFYRKNFSQPPKEKVERLRPPSPLSGENTIIVPTVGLQKVVIRVKDDRGEMAVAAVGVNPGLV